LFFRCAGLSDSMIDGIGISLDVFFQGCSLRCTGCHNPELHDFGGGFSCDTLDIIKRIEQYDFYDSIVFVGGEPLEQIDAVRDLAMRSNLCNVLYTGWNIDQIPIDIINSMNMIVAGPYIESLKTGGFPASSNQTIIKRNKNEDNSNIFGGI
jgi:anaerobic ribonucleoside-triphosphate reductase activating protein